MSTIEAEHLPPDKRTGSITVEQEQLRSIVAHNISEQAGMFDDFPAFVFSDDKEAFSNNLAVKALRALDSVVGDQEDGHSIVMELDADGGAEETFARLQFHRALRISNDALQAVPDAVDKYDNGVLQELRLLKTFFGRYRLIEKTIRDAHTADVYSVSYIFASGRRY